MLLRVLVAAQLAVILIAGAATVARFPVWALVDERAHFDYVKTVADDGRLPWLGRDLASPEALAIDDGTYPGPPRRPARERGLAGQSYEAFQPPLYYALAAPVFLAAGSDHVRKLRALRALGLVLLAVTAWLLWLLARRVLGPRRALAGYALALTILMWPGVVVRAVTVSNAALEPVIALAALVLLWDVFAGRGGRILVAAGAVVGLGLLTRLSFIVVVPLLLAAAIAHWRRGGSRAAAVAALALPVVFLAPWIASNYDRYDAATASAIVRDMQEPFLNPTGKDYGAGDLRALHGRLLNGVLAEEWWSQFLSSAKRRARDAFLVLFFALPLALCAIRPPPGAGRALALLAGPLALGIALMSAGLLAGNWDFFYPRYLYAVLPAFGVFAALVVGHALGERALVWTAAVLAAGFAALWAALATVTPFTA